jgi:hypothetical protein
VVIIWMLAGCFLLWWMNSTGRESWLLNAGHVFGESEAVSAGASMQQNHCQPDQR